MTKRVGSAWYRTLKYIAWVVLALPALTAVSGAAHGAGFALREQSGSALGNAFAGATAGAEDVSYMFFNPAGLTRHSGYQAALSISYVGPRGKLESASGSTITGATISGTSTIDDVAEEALATTRAVLGRQQAG